MIYHSIFTVLCLFLSFSKLINDLFFGIFKKQKTVNNIFIFIQKSGDAIYSHISALKRHLPCSAEAKPSVFMLSG